MYIQYVTDTEISDTIQRQKIQYRDKCFRKGFEFAPIQKSLNE